MLLHGRETLNAIGPEPMVKSFPSKIYNFIVADAVREEANKKVTVLGAMAGGNILVQGTVVFPVNIPLAFLVTFTDGMGEFETKFRVVDPNGKIMGQEFSLGKIIKNPDQAMQLIVNFNNIPIIKPGRFQVRVMLDDHVYDESFAVGVDSSGLSKP